MSVVVGIKDGGVVYLGADTQTTIGSNRQQHSLNEVGYKIHRFENGILFGACGSVQTTQVLLANLEIFTLDENGKLTKSWIVKEIIPKMRKILQDAKLLDEDGAMENSFVLAHGDKAYCVYAQFRVVARNDTLSIGAGRGAALYALNQTDIQKTVRERLIEAMEMSAKLVDSISAPYILIDTKNLEFEIVQGGKR